MKTGNGFTLIELLVVVAIIGILAAIAIPQFSEYRIRGFNSRAQSDARNFMTAQEAYFADTEDYSNCQNETDCVAQLPGFGVSSGVGIVAGNQDTWGAGAASKYYRVYACHNSGNMRYAITTDSQTSLTETPIAVGACAGF